MCDTPCSTQTNDEDQVDTTVIRLSCTRGCDVWVTPVVLQTVDALIADLSCKVSVSPPFATPIDRDVT